MDLDRIPRCPSDYNLPPVPSSFCSPTDLANAIVHWLNHRKSHPLPNMPLRLHWSEEGIRRIIDLVYYTSLHPEEGRYLPVKVVCQKDSNGYWRSIASFDPVPLNGVHDLLRLSPICTHVDRALFIDEKDESLWCNGIMCIGPIGYEEDPGSPSLVLVGFPPPLRLEVKGPGHILVSAVEIGYNLRAGKLQPLAPFDSSPGFQALCRGFISYLEQEVLRWGRKINAYDRFGPLRVWSPLPALLARMLHVAIEARHGGAFIILPTDNKDTAGFDVKLRYRTKDLDLGVRMIRFWNSCIDYHENQPDHIYEDRARIWNTERSKLYSDAEALGDLSSIDGCVVLNQRLQLCGFGAEIQVSDQNARESSSNFVSVRTRSTIDYETFMAAVGGTRHKSAARLVKAYPGAIAFVISQDGELRVFSSTGSEVHAFGPLDLPLPEDQRHLRVTAQS